MFDVRYSLFCVFEVRFTLLWNFWFRSFFIIDKLTQNFFQILSLYVHKCMFYTGKAIEVHIGILKCHFCSIQKMCKNVRFKPFLMSFRPLMTPNFTFFISFWLIWLKQSNTNILSGKRPLCDNFHENYNQICNPYPPKCL